MNTKKKDRERDDYMPIPIDDLVNGITAPVDFYIRLSDEKMILVLKTGGSIDKKQLTNYQNKEVYYLWVKKSQYYKVTEQQIAIAGVIIDKASLTVPQKTAVVTAVAKSIFHELDHIGISIETYNHAKQIAEATVALVEYHKDFTALFESLVEGEDELLRHSVAVSILSTMLGQGLNWENKVTLEKLALGGMLHDIGLKTLPPELVKKPKIEMSFDEIHLYETHCFRGMQLLASLGVVPDDVISIVYEHHENNLGQGYPRRIRAVKIHPMAKVVALANEFVNLTFKSPSNPHPKTPREAIMFIEHTMGQPYSRDVFQVLVNIVSKIPGDKRKAS